MTFEEAFKQVEDIAGWLGEADARVLFDYASKVKGVIVEIGCFEGRSTKLMALASPESKITTIDPFVLGSFPDQTEEAFRRNTEGLNVELIKDWSYVVGVTWDTPIDLLFIDGNHEYGDVERDMALFVPNLKSDHFALFHDYVVEGPGYGVKEAVLKFGPHFFKSIKEEAGIACCQKK